MTTTGSATLDHLRRVSERQRAARAGTPVVQEFHQPRPLPAKGIDILPGIKCGSCKGRHGSVAEVRACYGTKTPAPVAAAPAKVQERLDFDAIKAGNYAVPDHNGVIKFYRVYKKGGYTNVQVRASDALYPQKGKAGIAILWRIWLYGLEKSQMLFVTELGRCCRCGRSLTDEESRANALVNGGLGPDCVNM